MENYEKDHYWEFTLRDNPLTKDNTEDCVAEVKSGPKTLRNEDIAKEIKRTGSELKYATLLSVSSQINEIILEALLNGYSVMTDLCQFIPRITGAFDSPEAPFDPAIHKLTFDIILTKSVREALAKVKTINQGAKGETAGIGLVTDTLTGETNGAITPNDDILIAGNSIKIAGDRCRDRCLFCCRRRHNDQSGTPSHPERPQQADSPRSGSGRRNLHPAHRDTVQYQQTVIEGAPYH